MAQAERNRAGHSRMGRHDFFEFANVHRIAARLDHILCAPNQPDKSQAIARSDVQLQISQTEETKASLMDVMNFSRSISINLANAWKVAEIDQKPRVQNTLFFGDLKFDNEKGILNPGNDSVVCKLQNLLLGEIEALHSTLSCPYSRCWVVGVLGLTGWK